MTRWDALVIMTQLAFREGHLPDDLTWTTMTLLEKGQGDYRGIGMVEMIYNMIATIINNRLRA